MLIHFVEKDQPPAMPAMHSRTTKLKNKHRSNKQFFKRRAHRGGACIHVRTKNHDEQHGYTMYQL
jgi:hypothetical protein